MAEYRSGSTIRQHRWRELFLPPLIVWLLYGFISLCMLGFLNIPAFWSIWFDQTINISELTTLTDKFSGFQDRLGTPIVMVFWLFIGALTYFVIWFVENVFLIAKTEVEQSQYVYQNPALKKKYWESTLASNVFLAFAIMVFVSFIALYLRLLLPTYAHLFNSGLFSDPIYRRFIDIGAAIIGNVLSIYFLLLLRRIITYSWRATRI
jgi:hypothetical protein